MTDDQWTMLYFGIGFIVSIPVLVIFMRTQRKAHDFEEFMLNMVERFFVFVMSVVGWPVAAAVGILYTYWNTKNRAKDAY